MVGGHVLQLFHGGHALFFQQLKDLLHRLAFRDGHGNFFPAGGVAGHAVEQGAVVHVRVDLIGPLGDLVLAAGEGGEELKESLVFDDVVALELVCHAAEVALVVDGDGGAGALLVQGQHVVAQRPAHSGQHHGHSAHQHDIHHRAGDRGAFVLSPAGGIAVRLLPPSSGVSFHILPPGDPARFGSRGAL